jgi:hypothetical protein
MSEITINITLIIVLVGYIMPAFMAWEAISKNAPGLSVLASMGIDIHQAKKSLYKWLFCPIVNWVIAWNTRDTTGSFDWEDDFIDTPLK